MNEWKRHVMVEEELNEDISCGRKWVFFAAGGRSGVVSREQVLDVRTVRSRPPFNRRISQHRFTWLIKYDQRWLHVHASRLNWFPQCCSGGGQLASPQATRCVSASRPASCERVSGHVSTSISHPEWVFKAHSKKKQEQQQQQDLSEEQK